MPMLNLISQLWKRLMLRGTSFSGSYTKLRGLYLQSDPWQMSSAKEQHRFIETSRMLTEIAPQFGSILELGCGEGHQSEHLSKLTQNFYGLDVSDKAIQRAKMRCPTGHFAASELEQIDTVFGDQKFDLITGCEVLYYLSDISAALELLQTRTDLIFVSNYSERAKKMRPHFEADNWHRLDDIQFEGTVWECHYWRR